MKRDEAAVYIDQAWREGGDDTRATLQYAFWCCGLKTWNDSEVAREPCDGLTPDAPAVGTTCEPLMVQSFKDNYQTAGSCGIAFSVIMLASLAFSAYLMRGIRESAINKAIEKNRVRNDKDMAKRKKGKGLKIPQLGADVL